MIKLRFFFIFSFLMFGNAQAQERLRLAQSYMDTTHRFISDSWVMVNHGFDTYFSEKEYAKSDNQSEITVSLSALKKESEEFEHSVDLRLRVHLPKISDRLSATIEKETDRVVEAQGNEAEIQREVGQESSYTADVRYSLIDSIRGQFDVSTGLRFDLPLDPFVRVELARTFENRWLNVHMGQYFIYYRQRSLREYTRLGFSRSLGENWSFRQNNVLSWQRTTSKFVFRNSLDLNHRFSDKSVFVYSFGANAFLSPTYYYYRYDAALSWRRKLYKDWIFGSLTGGVEFYKERDWTPDGYGLVRTEIVF